MYVLRTKCYVGEELPLPEWRKKCKKVLPSVNASRKEKSDNKLAFEKQDEQADTSISTNSEGEQKEKTIKSTKTLRLKVQLAFKVDLLNFS